VKWNLSFKRNNESLSLIVFQFIEPKRVPGVVSGKGPRLLLGTVPAERWVTGTLAHPRGRVISFRDVFLRRQRCFSRSGIGIRWSRCVCWTCRLQLGSESGWAGSGWAVSRPVWSYRGRRIAAQRDRRSTRKQRLVFRSCLLFRSDFAGRCLNFNDIIRATCCVRRTWVTSSRSALSFVQQLVLCWF